ncbi:DrmB family protein [Streptomonospora algeriensis]|uniref:DrmB family protein n=1 Tax=Streptomonospora algeriensis TaxID=995084 RepID=A0ABW3B9Y7_9ACTN
MTLEPQRVGELRANQLLHTFGIGAIVDLPNLSVVVLGLDDWKQAKTTVIREDRLLAAIRRKLGGQVADLRTPPYTPPTKSVYDEWARVGVPVAIFPRWLRCTSPRCSIVAPADSGLFHLLPDLYRPDKSRYVHSCTGEGGKRPAAVPARFLLACEEGHLDDFPWMFYAHRGAEPASGDGGHTLILGERGTSGEAANVFVRCACGAGRSMAEAIGADNAVKNLPACRGRHPHLGVFEGCGKPVRAMNLGATNSWFPLQIRVFSLPKKDNELDNDIAENWAVLKPMAALPKEAARPAVTALNFWPQLEHHGYDKVWTAIQHRAATGESADEPDEDDEIDLARPEWEAFTQTEPVSLPEFTTQHVATPKSARGFLERVVLVPRLREVGALYGFTRVDAPEFDVLTTDHARVAPLSTEPPSWVPCAEQRGEGVFLKFSEERISAWESVPAVLEREKRLAEGHERWRAARQLKPGEWPGARYVLLHSLAHVLIREFALESGYGASGIAERIYARGSPQPMAGILLYTAAPDSEGTLGGLVSLGRDPGRLGTLVEQALDAARLCSSDPLCAEHDPADHARLYGAACHACLFAAETSCERGNHYLDRALVVGTMSQAVQGAGFFE